eukprot:m.445486 g.445486  ORF g.445486 m.445486 type:complete len:408 (-) comp21494_c0_seq1:2821-4044(-)
MLSANFFNTYTMPSLSIEGGLPDNLRKAPAFQAHTIDGTACGVQWGVGSLQGHRPTMEDAHLAAEIPGLPGHIILGVFDGHGGSKCARNAVSDDGVLQHFLERIQARMTRAESQGLPSSMDIAYALHSAVVDFDVVGAAKYEKGLEKNPALSSSGSTVCLVVITPTDFVVLNVGDSRLVVSRGDPDVNEPFSTTDHKPSTPLEKARIKKAHGRVMFGRVNGSLSVSRALGDYEMKNPSRAPADQVITADGDVTILPRQACNDVIVIGCDGLWDVMSTEEVVRFARARMASDAAADSCTEAPSAISGICKDLLYASLAANSRDNITVVVVQPVEYAPPITPRRSHSSSGETMLADTAGAGSDKERTGVCKRLDAQFTASGNIVVASLVLQERLSAVLQRVSALELLTS